MDIPTVLQNWPLQAVAAIIAGVVVLLAPRILNYAIAAYLLVVGTLGLLHFTLWTCDPPPDRDRTCGRRAYPDQAQHPQLCRRHLPDTHWLVGFGNTPVLSC